MASGIVYLDVDDEITSAAARIRSSTATKVALVVPYGSRIATSRMNFRLLSREAVVSNRRLSIVAGDAASRALAASAGLPVFATVAEYESTMESGAAAAEPKELPALGGASRAAAAAAMSLAASETVAAVGPAAGLADTDEEPAAPPQPPPPATTRRPMDDTTRMAVPAAAAAGAGAAAAATGAIPRPAPETRPRATRPIRADEADDGGAVPRRRIATPVLVAAGLVALAAIVIAVGGYLLLPSASIAVTPKREPISVELTVSADPDATAVDPATGVVPAVRLDVPVEASDTFTTTGVHVEQTAARGEVTFSNYNPVSSNTVPGGSIVATEGGIRFKTLASVTIPAGTFVLPNVVPSTRRVAVQAVRAGTEGNVPANAIRVVPQGENPDFLKVTNNDPTDGGTRTETPEVTQAEVDKAVADLQTQLQANFDDAIASGAGAPPDTTLFPATAKLGTATTEPDPKTLVGQAVPTFDLKLTATGTVIAVDPRPVREIAHQQLDGKVGTDHRLVDGSVQIDVGDGTVGEDGSVSFQATANAERVPILDASQLRTLVKGRTKAEAEAALAPFGTATVSLWPDWVSTVPSLDARLDLKIDETGAAGSPSGSSPRPSTARPSTPRAPSPAAPSPAGSAAP